MRTINFFLGFIGLLALIPLADFVGGLIPEWVGYAFLISVIAGLVTIIAKLGKVNR